MSAADLVEDHVAQNYREIAAQRGESLDELADRHEREYPGDRAHRRVASWARAEAAEKRAAAGPVEPEKVKSAPKRTAAQVAPGRKDW